jgi:hypothetical protein
MSTPPNGSGKGILERIARRVMKERGFLTDFSRSALDELEKIQQIDWEVEAHKKDLLSALGID